MPLIESEPDAVAQTYARSLFELAESEGGQVRTEDILGELEDILEIARSDASFGEFISSRIVSAEAREETLRTILDGRASDLTLRFMLVLNRKRRLGALSGVVAAYDAIVQERFGRIEVDVFTPAPADADQLGSIKERLGSLLGKEIVLHPYTDEKMIGGIKLRIGDQLIDGSVETQIRRLRDRFAAGGRDQIRAGAERFLGDL
ncbi:MAG: ATP synthase F1 subunit delta [Planctomycetota bacterium]